MHELKAEMVARFLILLGAAAAAVTEHVPPMVKAVNAADVHHAALKAPA